MWFVQMNHFAPVILNHGYSFICVCYIIYLIAFSPYIWINLLACVSIFMWFFLLLLINVAHLSNFRVSDSHTHSFTEMCNNTWEHHRLPIPRFSPIYLFIYDVLFILSHLLPVTSWNTIWFKNEQNLHAPLIEITNRTWQDNEVKAMLIGIKQKIAQDWNVLEFLYNISEVNQNLNTWLFKLMYANTPYLITLWCVCKWLSKTSHKSQGQRWNEVVGIQTDVSCVPFFFYAQPCRSSNELQLIINSSKNGHYLLDKVIDKKWLDIPEGY